MRELAGHVGVDAGLIWIGDPCYILHDPNPSRYVGKDWPEFCEKFDEQRGNKGLASFNYELGHEGLGICMETAYGDGTYPVYVERDREGRIIRATIEFDYQEED
jgi:hypothetical protein